MNPVFFGWAAAVLFWAVIVLFAPPFDLPTLGPMR